ncbi:MAG: hypothetical protein K0S65_3547 [Labilithrix sp.]|nr:hypothetical protein [Labilithrix sp.]
MNGCFGVLRGVAVLVAFSNVACNVLTGASDLAADCVEKPCAIAAPRRTTTTSATEPLDAGESLEASAPHAPATESKDAGPAPDSKEEPTHTPGVRCGDVRCDGAEPACCSDDWGLRCVDDVRSCSSYGVALACDEPSDCGGGEVCCLGAYATENTAVCLPKRDCDSAATMVLCSNAADCLAGEICLPFVASTGYGRCVAW